jgi:hypothetical protein
MEISQSAFAFRGTLREASSPDALALMRGHFRTTSRFDFQATLNWRFQDDGRWCHTDVFGV